MQEIKGLQSSKRIKENFLQKEEKYHQKEQDNEEKVNIYSFILIYMNISINPFEISLF